MTVRNDELLQIIPQPWQKDMEEVLRVAGG